MTFSAIFLRADARQFLLPFVRTSCFVHVFHVGAFSSMQMGLLKARRAGQIYPWLGGLLLGIMSQSAKNSGSPAT
jgi:hypothetical protein